MGIVLKTGIIVRVGRKNKDLIDMDDDELAQWIGTLNPAEIVSLVKKLLKIVRMW